VKGKRGNMRRGEGRVLMSVRICVFARETEEKDSERQTSKGGGEARGDSRRCDVYLVI
jgi:hypothetical protein